MFQKTLLLLLLPLLWSACTDQENPIVESTPPPPPVVAPAWTQDYRLLFTPDGKSAKITPEQIEKEVMGRRWVTINQYSRVLTFKPEPEYRLQEMSLTGLYRKLSPPVFHFTPDSITEINGFGEKFILPVERDKIFTIFSSPVENAPETPSNLIDFVERSPIDREHWVLLSLENDELVFMHYHGYWRSRSIIYPMFARCVPLPD